jgi:tetratricopeptide (TPR) repeat protein
LQKVISLEPSHFGAHCELGRLLREKGAHEDAVRSFREAIRAKPDDIWAHCDLGFAFRDQGQFAEALAALRRGHELGTKNPNWKQPSAQWVRECERLVELDQLLPAILQGDKQPANATERLELSHLCHLKRWYAAAAKLAQEAFAAQLELANALKTSRRYNAACAAALAGSGQGEDAGKLSDAERTRWRKQALAWLRADLALLTQHLETNTPQARRFVQQTLKHWQRDADLAALRDLPALANLPADEQEACKQLWADAEALLARAGAAD